MKNNTGSHPFMVWLLILLQVLLGLGALASGVALVLAPDGHLLQMSVSILKDAPFSSFLLPGMLLFTFVGVYPTAVAYSLWRRPAWRWPNALNPFKHIHWSWAGSLAAGAIVIIWISVQLALIGYGSLLQPFYMGWGVVILLLTLLPNVRQYYQSPPT